MKSEMTEIMLMEMDVIKIVKLRMAGHVMEVLLQQLTLAQRYEVTEYTIALIPQNEMMEV